MEMIIKIKAIKSMKQMMIATLPIYLNYIERILGFTKKNSCGGRPNVFNISKTR